MYPTSITSEIWEIPGAAAEMRSISLIFQLLKTSPLLFTSSGRSSLLKSSVTPLEAGLLVFYNNTAVLSFSGTYCTVLRRRALRKHDGTIQDACALKAGGEASLRSLRVSVEKHSPRLTCHCQMLQSSSHFSKDFQARSLVDT